MGLVRSLADFTQFKFLFSFPTIDGYILLGQFFWIWSFPYRYQLIQISFTHYTGRFKVRLNQSTLKGMMIVFIWWKGDLAFTPKCFNCVLPALTLAAVYVTPFGPKWTLQHLCPRQQGRAQGRQPLVLMEFFFYFGLDVIAVWVPFHLVCPLL